jgi:hypothetical protein
MERKSLYVSGPLLAGLLAVQAIEEQAVGYPQLARTADEVVDRAKEIPGCLVWPVGVAAERVAAAVTLRGEGAVEVGAWSTHVAGRDLLLVAVAGVSSLSLAAAAAQLRRRGANCVHACGVAVAGAEALDSLDSYKTLGCFSPSPSAPIVLGGDAA